MPRENRKSFGRGGRGRQPDFGFNQHVGPHPSQQVCISEEVKIGINLAIERFRMNEAQKELEFPSSLTATERAFIHRKADDLGCNHKSKGKGNNRYLTLVKKEGSRFGSVSRAATFQLVRNSRHVVQSLLQRFPVTNKERLELVPKSDKNQVNEVSKELARTATGRLNNGVPQVPPRRCDSDLNVFRDTLPINRYRAEILAMIKDNHVTLIQGETGSGKTTQVPQMILDDCSQRKEPCRIFCTQPRRIAALTIADRVAAERGEKVGQTVGFQIRLESRVSPKTLLTFCTNGVLLRTLMGNDNALSTVTHVFVDEVHERDKFSDFLLISLRELVRRKPNLRVILMSASLNTDLFVRYFDNCPSLSVPGSLFEVEEYFLEDILRGTGYTTKKMEKYRQQKEKATQQRERLSEWCEQDPVPAWKRHCWRNEEDDPTRQPDRRNELHDQLAMLGLGEEKEELEPWVTKEMDESLSEIWLHGNEDLFPQVFHLIMSENVSVDYIHSETSITPLMIAAGRGFTDIVIQLLSMGADAGTKAPNEWTALDWAKKFQREEIISILETHMLTNEIGVADVAAEGAAMDDMSAEDLENVTAYQHCWDDDRVDIDLVGCLLFHVMTDQPEGAILVFLPGYDDIVGLRNKMEEEFEGLRYSLFLLHSSMQSTDQKRVFKPGPPGVRKIILATNIAETSITINDVVYVIDAGKVKEKTFDALLQISMLKSTWISKASALQRMGRAGRVQPGVCYHVFSRIRHQNMADFATPELLRCPLQELCLQTKLLSPVNESIADFLAKAPEPPPFLVTRSAVNILKQMDALDESEELTELGRHLADLPVEPHLGKMVLNSIVLKCLDPVLTVVCSLGYKDPFQLPSLPFQKRQVQMIKKEFAADTQSDHMALLRAFQSWQKARTEGWEKAFCARNFLSSAVMEMIVGMRAQLLGQLRASGFVRARGGGDIRDLNTNSENWAVVKAALTAGAYPNIIRIDRQRCRLVGHSSEKVFTHMSSVLPQKYDIATLPSDWLFYEEMTRAGQLACVRCCTLVSPVTVAIFAGPAKLPTDALTDASFENIADEGGPVYREDSSDSEDDDREDPRASTLQLAGGLTFKADAEAASLALQLRQKWHCLFLRRMRAPSKPWSQIDDAVIHALVTVLTNEEQALGLQQPAGIGQRPKPMSAESIMSGVEEGGVRGPRDQHSDGRQPRFSTSAKKATTSPQKRKDFMSPNISQSGHGSANSSPQTPSYNSDHSTPCGSPQVGGHDMAGPNRYFIMKCGSQKQIDVSVSQGVWATSPRNEKILNKAFQSGKTVNLVFSIQGSGHFQGFARMSSGVGATKSPDFAGQGATFSIQWEKRGNMQFQHTHHLLNPWNENKRVQVSRDGQELEPSVGDSLLKLWDAGSMSNWRSQGSNVGGQGQQSYNLRPSVPRPYSQSHAQTYAGNSHGNEGEDYYDSYQGQDDFDGQNQGHFNQGQFYYNHGYSNQGYAPWSGNYSQRQANTGQFHGHQNQYTRSSHGFHGNSDFVAPGYQQNEEMGYAAHPQIPGGYNPYSSPQHGASPIMILQRDANRGSRNQNRK